MEWTLLLLLLPALDPGEVFAGSLFTVTGDGEECAPLDAETKSQFRDWKLDPERTAESRGIYGLYNPDAPEQLVLFFREAATCRLVLSNLELPPDEGSEKTTGTKAKNADPEARGNAREVSPADARAEMLEIDTATKRSLWCSCEIDRKEMRCNDEEALEVSYTDIVAIRTYGPTFESWHSGHPDCVRRRQPFSGRRCAALVDPEFRRMSADLYNLAPQITRVSYLERDLRPPLPDACIRDRRATTVRPDKTQRGLIARTYLYMNASYPEHVAIDPALRNTLERWHRESAPSASECQRGRVIAERQGNANRWLKSCAIAPKK
ncbi:MAG: endonuclease [Myxococcota bacterium]